MAEPCDCLIVGAGPAGAALALLLARRGARVVLVDHGRGHRSGPFETVLGSARPMLARSGLAELLDAAAETDPLRHGAIWGGPELVWRPAAEPGWLLRRGAFDAGLRTLAADAGVLLRCPATARWSSDGRVHVIGTDAAQASCAAAETWAPLRLVLATGRAAAGRRTAPGPRTFAYTFVGEPAPSDRGCAVVEAVADAWTWTHVPDAGPASVCVLTDAAGEPARGAPGGRRDVLARALHGARGPASRLTDARLAFANDATPACADGPGPALANGDRGDDAVVLRLGDAAAVIDPLASQGVEKALAAADHAAAVITTASREPAWWCRLVATHARWEQGLFRAHQAAAAQWYAREERFADAPFWRARRAAAPATPEPPPPAGRVLRASPQVQAAEVLVREGGRFVAGAGFRDAATGDERTHVGHVPIAPLLAAFDAPCTPADALRRAGADARLFVLAPRAVHAAMLELEHLGWLVPISPRPARGGAGNR